MPRVTMDEPRVRLALKVWLLWRVWWMAAGVSIALRRRPLPGLAARWAGAADGSRPLPVALLSRAVTRGLRVGPWAPRCVIRSLVLYRLLREQGEDAILVIGTRPVPTSSDAHAWVELAGIDVGPAPGSRGYVELTRYPLAS